MPKGWFRPSRNTSRVSATPSPSAVAQQRDAVRAHPDGGGASHRGDHGVVEDRPRRAVRAHGLGDQHVAIGQHLDPARMLEAGREGVDRRARAPRSASGPGSIPGPSASSGSGCCPAALPPVSPAHCPRQARASRRSAAASGARRRRSRRLRARKGSKNSRHYFPGCMPANVHEGPGESARTVDLNRNSPTSARHKELP